LMGGLALPAALIAVARFPDNAVRVVIRSRSISDRRNRTFPGGMGKSRRLKLPFMTSDRDPWPLIPASGLSSGRPDCCGNSFVMTVTLLTTS
jgi:hypothetical protein